MGGDTPYAYAVVADDADAAAGQPVNTPAGGGFLSGLFEGSMNPALIAAAAQVFSSAVAPSAAGPSRVDSQNSFGFDNSGFVVDFGPGGATSTKTAGVPSWLLAGGVAGAILLGLVWIKKKA